MSTALESRPSSAADIDARVSQYDWPGIVEHLDAYGWATFPELLTAEETAAVAGLYGDDTRFRSRIVMARHGFGRGEYKYFAYPLPHAIAELRTALYPGSFRSRTGGMN